MKKALKFLGGLFGALFVVLIIALVVDISNDDEQKASEKPVEEKVKETEIENKPEATNETETETEVAAETEKVEITSWEDKVKEVAAADGTETEKFDEISLYANDYEPSVDEVKEFEQYIINEYKNKKYLEDISNHEYMLSNIFKSQVVEEYYEEGNPIKDFAFDFWQNSKYNYRGVENSTSGSTISNEQQMDKALEKIK